MSVSVKKQTLNILLGLCLSSVSSLPAWAGDSFLAKPTAAEREAAVHGHDDGLLAWPGITGEWGGARDSMEEHGVSIEAVYTGEFARNFDANAVTGNGQKRTIYHTNTDITLTIDTEKLGLWSGGTLFIYGLGNTGGSPSAYTGDLQGYSNIDASYNWLLYEAWYEQQFGDVASLLMGLHDMNSEFYTSDYASLFLQSSFGIGPTVSGNITAPSIFPKAGLAARLKVTPTENMYIQAAIYDGDPTTRGFKAGEGNMYIAESGMSSDTGTYKVGYWQHTAAVTFGANNFANDHGVYGVIDQQIASLDGDASIGWFLQYGYAPKDRNQVFNYVGSGFHVHGLIPSRGEDDLGIAIARANTHINPTAANVAETTTELTYRLVATPWFAVQPSFQIIQKPGGDAAAPTVKAGLLRFEISL
ncbi:MAG: carbohydrate porin [Mariprofundaceae bacterium]|nr:carbohydrate porin [Mariprofundaceae bacterium]